MDTFQVISIGIIIFVLYRFILWTGHICEDVFPTCSSDSRDERITLKSSLILRDELNRDINKQISKMSNYNKELVLKQLE